MPESGSPFSRTANNRKRTDEELIRALKFEISGEFEAIQRKK